jgi:hypothetical protein
MVMSSCHHTCETEALCPVQINKEELRSMLQTRAVQSAEPVANFVSSGDHAKELIEEVCPENVINTAPFLVSCNRATPSECLDKSFVPSRDHITDVKADPESFIISLPSLLLYTLVPDTILNPSGDQIDGCSNMGFGIVQITLLLLMSHTLMLDMSLFSLLSDRMLVFVGTK